MITLNLGCGDDKRGEVRIDMNPERKGLNLIADIHSIPLRTSVFDGVFCDSVFEHVMSPFKVLSEMARVSKKRIRVIVPNVHRLMRIKITWLNPLREVNKNTKHLQIWDAIAFKLLVHQVGGLRVLGIYWDRFPGALRRPSILFGKQMIVDMRVQK